MLDGFMSGGTVVVALVSGIVSVFVTLVSTRLSSSVRIQNELTNEAELLEKERLPDEARVLIETAMVHRARRLAARAVFPYMTKIFIPGGIVAIIAAAWIAYGEDTGNLTFGFTLHQRISGSLQAVAIFWFVPFMALMLVTAWRLDWIVGHPLDQFLARRRAAKAARRSRVAEQEQDGATQGEQEDKDEADSADDSPASPSD